MSTESKLKELILSQYRSIREFATAVNMPYSTVDSIFKRGLDKAGVANIIKICQQLHISVDELAEGRIISVKNDQSVSLTPAEQRIGLAYGVADPPVKRTVEVALEPYMDEILLVKKAPRTTKAKDAEIAEELDPEFDAPVLQLYTQPSAAGLGNYLDDSDYELVPFLNAPGRADIAVRISGDSMEPEYRDGDIVFVETESVLQDGEVGVFNYDGEGFIKKLRLNPPRLVSLNPAYSDIVINTAGDILFKTIGRVVGIAEI